MPQLPTITINDVAEYYLETLRCRHPESVAGQLRHIESALGSLDAEDLRGWHLTRYRAGRRRLGRQDSTINREVAYLRAAMRRAQADGLIENLPAFRLEREENIRDDLLSIDQVRAIAARLKDPLGDLVRFGFWSGWRKNAILNLTWRNVEVGSDGPGFIHMPQELSKNKRPVSFPIVGPMQAIIERRKSQAEVAGVMVPWIFHRHGQQVKSFYRAWRAAQLACGINPPCVFHALRRSMVTHYRQKGNISESEILALAGMKTRSILDRYTISRGDALIAAVQQAASV